MLTFFLKARHVVNKVLLISLFHRRHGVNKMGLSGQSPIIWSRVGLEMQF